MKNSYKILVDISHATSPQIRGIGIYERNILEQMPTKEVIYVGVSPKPYWLNKKSNYLELPFKFIPIREQVIIPYLAIKFGVKQLHMFGNVMPLILILIKKIKVYLTVHDVSFTYSKKYIFC